MPNPLLHWIFVAVAGATAVAGDVAAAPTEGQRASHPCAAVSEPMQRLACYDKVFAPATSADSVAATISDEARELQEFGLSQTQVREQTPQAQRKETRTRIEAKIARVSARPTGERVVTLDNGQVWLLTEVTSRGRLTQGDPVIVRKAALGSFMLVTTSGVALRARRIP